MKLRGRGDEAHRAAEVRAAGRERDVGAGALARERVGIAAAHVGGGLASLADPLDQGEDDRLVGVSGEAADRADALPALLGAVEDRRHREPDRGQDDHRAGDPADRLAGHRQTPCAGSSTRPRSSRADPASEDRRRQRKRCSCRRRRPRFRRANPGGARSLSTPPHAPADRGGRTAGPSAERPARAPTAAPRPPLREGPTFPARASGAGARGNHRHRGEPEGIRRSLAAATSPPPAS